MSFALQNLICVVSLSAVTFAQATQTDTPDRSRDIQEIRRSIQQVEQGFVSRDPEPFERLYIEGYVNIREKPVFNYREQLAAMVRWDAAAIRSGKKLDFETLSYESDEPVITVLSDAAIVNSLRKNLWRYKDDRCLTQYQSTELWIRLDGVWKVAASHVSTIQCDPMPWLPPHPAVSATRTQTKPTRFLSPTAETELRELISKLSDSGIRSDNNSDAFTAGYVSTATNGSISSDRSILINALRVPTGRNNERYRDDEVFLNFGPAAIYLFRIRSFPKAGETDPPAPIVVSAMFVRSGGSWLIAASHASAITD